MYLFFPNPVPWRVRTHADSAEHQSVVEVAESSSVSVAPLVGTSDLLVGGRFKIEKKHYFNQHSKVWRLR